MDQILPYIISFIVGFASKYPVVASILMLIGTLRLIFKPLFTFLHAIGDAVDGTPDGKNVLIDNIEQSNIVKTIAFILDLFASVKLPEKK